MCPAQAARVPAGITGSEEVLVHRELPQHAQVSEELMKLLKIATFSSAVLEEKKNSLCKMFSPIKPSFGTRVFGRKLSSAVPVSDHFAEGTSSRSLM